MEFYVQYPLFLLLCYWISRYTAKNVLLSVICNPLLIEINLSRIRTLSIKREKVCSGCPYLLLILHHSHSLKMCMCVCVCVCLSIYLTDLVQIRYPGSSCKYLEPFFLVFPLPLKLRVIHIRKKFKISCLSLSTFVSYVN